MKTNYAITNEEGMLVLKYQVDTYPPCLTKASNKKLLDKIGMRHLKEYDLIVNKLEEGLREAMRFYLIDGNTYTDRCGKIESIAQAICDCRINILDNSDKHAASKLIGVDSNDVVLCIDSLYEKASALGYKEQKSNSRLI